MAYIPRVSLTQNVEILQRADTIASNGWIVSMTCLNEGFWPLISFLLVAIPVVTKVNAAVKSEKIKRLLKTKKE